MSVELPYRPCVGIMLCNSEGMVWVGRRIAKPHDDHGAALVWQMPQGGIDKGETPEAAAYRELAEETGVRSANVIGESKGWLNYDLPDHLIGTALKGKFRGQTQKWFAMRFSGHEDEIDITGDGGEAPEFDQWRWVPLNEVTRLVVPFKRDVYVQVAAEFAALAVPKV